MWVLMKEAIIWVRTSSLCYVMLRYVKIKQNTILRQYRQM